MIAAGQRVIPYRRGQRFRIYPIFDVHLGNKGCAEESFRQHIGRLRRDRNGYWIGGGDYTDGIHYSDKRFDARSLPKWMQTEDLDDLPKVLFDYFAAIMEPVADRCLGVCWGNHEYTMLRSFSSWSRWSELCKRVGATNMEVSGFRDVVFEDEEHRRTKLRILVAHGGGWAATAGAKTNRLRKMLDDFPGAGLALMGHLHDQIDARKTGIDADEECKVIIQSTRLAVMGGTWLRAYTQGFAGYAEIRQMSPVPLGNPVIEVEPETLAMQVGWPTKLAVAA